MKFSLTQLNTKSTRLVIFGFLVVAFVFLINIANAAINPEINYQAKLTDTAGAAVADGDYEITYKLYTVPTGGGAIFTEVATSTVTNGLFSYLIGSSTSLSGVDFNQTLYLGVEIESDGEMTPRKRLGAVPAAFEANNAETFAGIATTSFLRSDIADIASSLLTFTSGLISQSSSTISELTTSTTTVTTFVIDGEEFTSISGGSSGLTNVGGTLTANISESNLNVAAAPTNGYVLQASSTSAGGFVWQATSSLGFSDTDTTLTVGSDNQIPFSNGGGTDLEYSSNFTFDGTNLTIGTSTGSDKLTVQNGNVKLSTFGGNSTLNFFQSNGTEGTPSNTVGGDVLMSIDSYGRVNAASTQLATQIQVVSNDQWTSGVRRRGDIVFNYQQAFGGEVLEKFRFDSFGNFGLADASPDFHVEIAGTTTLDWGGTSALGYFGISSASTTDGDIFTVDLSGNVGIGTTTPSYDLSVVGDTVITGALRDNSYSAGTNGMVLQTTGSGFNWVATSSLGFPSAHDAVTLAGEDFLSLSGQQITANAINADNLSASDFGDFTCNGTTCVLDDDTVGTAELENSIPLSFFTDDVGFLSDITGELFYDLSDTPGSYTANRVLYQGGGGVTDDADFTFDGLLLTLGGTGLTLSGTTANIALGSNWLSGDGDDEGVFVSSTGNVGIGTTSPASTLDVWGDFRVGTSSTPTLFVDTSADQLMLGTTTAYGSYPLYIEDGAIAFRNTGNLTRNGTIQASGSGYLQVDSTIATQLMAGGDNILQLQTNSGAVFNVDGDSNLNFIMEGDTNGNLFYLNAANDTIGISTSTATQTFTVDGSTYLTGALYDNANSAGTNGMVLQTTGSGFAWVATSSLGFAAAGTESLFTDGGADTYLTSLSDRFAIGTSSGTVNGNTAKASIWSSTAGVADTLRLVNQSDGTGRGPSITFSSDSYDYARIAGVKGSGASNSNLSFYTGSVGALTQQMTLDQSGDLSISTTTSDAKLSIQTSGTKDILNLFETDGAEVFTVLESGNTSVAGNDLIDVDDISFNGGANDLSYLRIPNKGATDRLDIFDDDGTGAIISFADSGNVGIGTTNPGGKLEIEYAGTTGLLIDSSNTANNVSAIRFNRTGTNVENGLSLDTAGARKWFFGQDNDSTEDLLLYGQTNTRWIMNVYDGSGDVAFGSVDTASPSLYIEYDGNVGIGTSSPVSVLDLWSNTSSDIISVGDFDNDAVVSAFVVHDENDGEVLFDIYGDGTGGSSLVNMYVSGNLGIGTTSPYAKLSISQTGGGTDPLFVIASSTNGAGTSTALFVNENGQVIVGDNQTSSEAALVVYKDSPSADQTIFQVGTSDISSVFSVDEDGDVDMRGTELRFTNNDRVRINALRGGSVQSDYMQFYSGDVLGMHIQYGKVGIGTTSPDTRLHIGSSTPNAITAGEQYNSAFIAGSLEVDGALYDNANSAGTNGMVLQTTGSGFAWVATSSLGLGGSSGTVTSVDMSVPTGLAISGNPITTSGTLALTYDTGYTGVLTASTTEWDTAYGWGDHSVAGYQSNALTNGYVFRGGSGNTAEATSTLFINDSGNVGVGTITPRSLFTISGNTTDRGTLGIENDDTDIQAGETIGSILFRSNEGSASSPPTDDIVASISTIASKQHTGGDWGSELAFSNVNSSNVLTERMRIDANGYVGIGTSTDLSARLTIQTTGTDDILNLLEAGGTEVLTVLESGNVGIGTTTPDMKLTVAGSGINVNRPSNPTITGGVNTDGESYAVAVVDRYAYVADGPNGLEIIDVSDPASPAIVGGVDTDGKAFGVALYGRYAYIADGTNGLEIIDVSDPTNPTIVGGVDTDDDAYYITLAGPYAYVSDNTNGLEIIDVSDPTNPTIVGGIDTDGSAYGATVVGRYAYLADGNSGLKIIDVSDPTNPTIVGEVNTTNSSRDVTVSGRYAYVAHYSNGVEIFDVSDPTNPTSVGTVDTDAQVRSVALAGRYLYAADGSNGLEIIDVFDPTNPVIVGGVDTANLRSLTVSGRYVYAADHTSGLQIIDINGSEFSSLFAGTLGATQASFDQDLIVGQNALVNSNLSVGSDARIGGNLAIQGYASSTDTVNQALLTLGGDTVRNSFMSFTGQTSSTTANIWSMGLNQADNSFRIASSSGLLTNNYFTIGAGGNVGIGTSSPTRQLSVVSTGTSWPDAAIQVSNTVANRYAQIEYAGTGRTWTAGVGNASETLYGLADKFYVYDQTGNAVRMAIDTSGYVGIGTSSPQSRLHLNGGVGSLATGLSFGDGDSGIYELNDDSFRIEIAGVPKWRIGGGVLGNHDNAKALITDESPTATNPVFLPGGANDQDTGIGWASADILSLVAGGVNGLNVNAGDVGVGTTSPFAKFTVTGDVMATGALYDNSYSAGTNGMVLQTTGSGFAWVATSTLGLGGGGSSLTVGSDNEIPFSNAGGTDLEYSSNFTFDGTTFLANATTSIGTTTATNARLSVQSEGTADILNLFETGGTEVFTVLESGNVGIGTTTPSDIFHVYQSGGSLNLGTFENPSTATNGAASIDVFANTTKGEIKVYNSANTAAGGNLADSVLFGQYAGTGGVIIATDTAAPIRFTTNGVDAADERMRITATGNIGIGLTSPSTKLDVLGTASSSDLVVDNTVQLLNITGGILAVDGSGNVSASTSIAASGIEDAYVLNTGDTMTGALTMSGANIILNGEWLSGDGGDEGIFIDSSGNVGIGTTSPGALLTLDNNNLLTGNVTAGIEQYITLENATLNAVQYGDRAYIKATSTATSTIVGGIIRIEDATTLGNTVRGFEVQANKGANTQGENTALSGFARTFGVRGYSSGDAGGSFEPAGGFFETGGSTQGNAIRGYSASITTAELLSLFQEDSVFTGTGLLMNFGNDTGSFASTSSKFVDFQNAGTSKFTVTAHGTTTIGDGTTSNQAGLQIGFGGLCVDNDGSCVASTTGRISSVSSYTGNSDLAEMYFSSENLTPGEIVVTDGFISIERATGDNGQVLGVVSTKPGLVLGSDDTSLVPNQRSYPLALSGRVPVRLSNENGNIAVGDPLTLSSLPGIAMKATEADTIVGYALEAFDGTYAYTDGFVNQFGDDIAEPNYEAINVNPDTTEKESCYFGGGLATGEEGEECDPEAVMEELAEPGPTAEEIAQARYEAEQAALNALRNQAAETYQVDDAAVKVGTVTMFVDRGYHFAAEQMDIFNELTSTSTDLVLGAEPNSGETLWSRLKELAQGFVDGVLSIAGLKADKVETSELCIDDVCVTADDLRALLEAANTNSTAQPPAEEEETEEEGTENTEDNTDSEGDNGNGEETAASTDSTASSTEEVVEETASTTDPVTEEEDPAPVSEEETPETEGSEGSEEEEIVEEPIEEETTQEPAPEPEPEVVESSEATDVASENEPEPVTEENTN